MKKDAPFRAPRARNVDEEVAAEGRLYPAEERIDPTVAFVRQTSVSSRSFFSSFSRMRR